MARTWIALIVSIALFISFSGCLDTLFPYGMPGQENPNPRERAEETPLVPQTPSNVPSSEPDVLPIEKDLINRTNANGSNSTAGANESNATYSINVTVTKTNQTSPQNESNQTQLQPWPDADYPLELLFFNVGFGDAAMIRRGNFTILVDAGSEQTAPALLGNLTLAGVSRIDMFILTSWDSPEAGGVPKILSKIPANMVLHNNMTPDFANATAEFFRKSKAQQQFPQRGVNYTIGDLRIEFYLPPVQRAIDNQNLNTLAFTIRRGEFCAFFGGQMEQEEEPAVLSAMENTAKCHVLKLPNHGAGRPTPSILTDRLSPIDAVLSVGPNPYDLPAQATVERLRIRGVNLWRTDQNGSVYVSVAPPANGTNYTIYGNANISAIGQWHRNEMSGTAQK